MVETRTRAVSPDAHGRASASGIIARGLGASQDMSTEAPDSDKEHDTEAQYPEQPWRYKRILTELYHEEGLTLNETAEELGCNSSTVGKWASRYGLLDQTGRGGEPAYIERYPKGYETWAEHHKGERWRVKIHRLLAVAEFGFGAVADKAVHHRNDVPWDNRGGNFRVLSHSEHAKWHGRARSLGLTPNGNFGQFTDAQIDAVLDDETWRDVGGSP